MDWKQIVLDLKDIDLSKPDSKSMLQDLPAKIQKLIDENNWLRNELGRFRGYVENASDTITEMDLQGRIIYTNNNWLRYLGYKTEDVLNKRIFESLFHPDDVSQASTYLQRAIDSKQVQTGFEYRIRHKNGEYRWHMANIAPVLNEQGEVERIIAVAHSIHKQKQAMLKVRDSEALYRLLLNTMREAVIMVDNDDVIKYVNPSCCELFGISAEDAMGKRGYEVLVIDADRHIIRQKNQDRLQGIVDDYEVRGRKATGEIIWLRISGAPITDETGAVIGSVGIMTDITSHKKAQEAIKRSEENYRRLFENAIAGAFQSTMDNKFLHVNKAFATMFGYQDPQEMMDLVKEIKKLYVDPEDRERMKEILIDKGFVENYEVEMLKKNGEHIWVSMFVRLTPNLEGKTVIEGTNIDITESKFMQEQLLASQKMDAIGKLASGIAHDFNNLLTVILGYSEDILEELSENHPLYKPADEIVKAGVKAAYLTQQLLAFSRKQLIHAQELDCNNLLNNIKSIILRLSGEDIALNMHLAKDLKTVKINPEQLEQLIVNLVINAREAMPDGGVLKINTENTILENSISGSHTELPSGEYVLLSISDTGIGIPKELQGRIFEPFFSTKDHAQGLGLATVWGIVRQSGGFVYVYSEPDQGTVFKIFLPVSGKEPELKRFALPRENTGENESIMVVEDEKALGNLLKRMLGNLGYQVQVYSDSQKALDAFRKGKLPDLLITDVVMPKMSGKELVDAVFKMYPEQKVLFMSGFADDVIAQHGILSSKAPFIQKPFTAREIGPQIRQILSSGKSPYRILVLDDETGIRNLLVRSCEKYGFICQGVARADSAIAELKQKDYNLLLVDLNLEEFDGVQAIRLIRKAGFSVPIIVLSGMIQPGILDELRPLGVINAIEKSFDSKALLDYITHYFQSDSSCS